MAYANINPNNAYFPAVLMRNSTITFNFGESVFQYLPSDASPIPYISMQKQGQVSKRNLIALILEPTRELAIQTYLLLFLLLITRYDCLMRYRSFMKDPMLEIVLLLLFSLMV